MSRMPSVKPSVNWPRRKWSARQAATSSQKACPMARWIPESPRTANRFRLGTRKISTPLRSAVSSMPSRRKALAATFSTSPQKNRATDTRISEEVSRSASRMACSTWEESTYRVRLLRVRPHMRHLHASP